MLDDFKRRFHYRRDKRDRWHFLEGAGPVFGDCEDFAITCGLIECGGSKWRWWWKIMTFQMVVWMVWTPTGGEHAALWMRGKGWIDNWSPNWSPELKHHAKRFPYPWPLIPFKLRKYRS